MNVDFKNNCTLCSIKSYFKIVLIITVVFHHTISLANIFSTLVGSLKLSGVANGVTLAGDYAYVATCSQRNLNNGKLEIVDIKDPTKLRVVGSVEVAGCIGRVAILGIYAYVSECKSGGGFKIINIANPKKPILVGSYGIGSCTNGIVVADSFLYTVDTGRNVGVYSKKDSSLLKVDYEKGGGLKIFNIKNPIAPTLVGNWGSNREIKGLTVTKNYAYVIDMGAADGVMRRTDGVYEDAGLKIVDITNPKNPVFISKLRAYRVFGRPIVAGNYAYIVESSLPTSKKSELKIINVTNPKVLTVVGSLKVDVSSAQLEAVKDNYAYISYHNYIKQLDKINEENGIKIVNITDLTNPILVGSLKIDGFINEVALADNYIYVTSKSELKVYQM